MHSTKRGVVLGLSIAGLFTATGVAPAYANSPWWHLKSEARPSDLQPGKAKDEVQEIKVSATAGAVAVIEPVSIEELLKGKIGFGELKKAIFAYNASPEEVQASLEGIYGVGNLEVTGGPGDTEGTKPYLVTFKGALEGQSLGLMNTGFSALFGGLVGEATVTETSKGSPDGYIVVTAADLGDASVEGGVSPVTMADKLPVGVRPVHIEAITGENGVNEALAPAECTLASLSCTFGGYLPDYDSIEMIIAVVLEPDAQAGELNEAVVSGGGAPSTMVKRPLTIVSPGSPPTQFGVQTYELDAEEVGGAVDTQAGSHPFQLTTTLALNETFAGNPVALTKDLHFKLPPGLIGNPTPFAQCTLAQFYTQGEGLSNECAVQTVVGVARVTVKHLLGQGGNTITVATPLYNLEPATGEPARFGFEVLGVPVLLDTSVRTGEDYGVTVTVDNITQTASFLANEVTFWGVPGDERHEAARGYGCLENARNISSSGKYKCTPLGAHTPPPLLVLPTSCNGPLHSTVEADSWKQEGAFQTFGTVEPLQALDGCNRLQFEPSITVAPDGQAGSTPTGLTVAVHVPQDVSLDAEGLAEADVQNTTVTLPEGVALNPAAADGLLSCTDVAEPKRPEGEIALHSDAKPECPEASKVGTVKIVTPLLPNALEGAAYLAAQDANPFGSLVALYVVAEDPVSGTLVKVAGEVLPNEEHAGQLVSRFENTPQLPFEEFQIKFFGGSRAPLSTPALCGGYTTTAAVEPWTGTGAVDSSTEFRITSGPNGSPCPNPEGDQSLSTLPFAPFLTAGTTSIQAGGFSPFTMTMSREDGNQNLKAISLHMPAGLSGTLSGVTLCGEPQADAGTCGPESQVGETTVSVGLGGDPFSVTGGKVYITGPYGGAPFGLSIVVPAKAGPFDLGQVVVRARIEVDPTTAALTVTSDSSGPYAIPPMIDGIPLQIKHVNVTINRPGGFTFNPTNCEKTAITGALTSIEGATSALSVPFQVTNCAVLGFKPQLEVSTSSHTSRNNGASLDVKVLYPKAPFGSQANIGKFKVELPKQLPSRLTTLQKACTSAQFDAEPEGCPTASKVGQVSATTPLLSGTLTGTAYFVSHGGAKFPELIMVLTGEDGVRVELHAETFISKAGITSATLNTVPDVPVGTFELKLPEGPDSALAANGNLCTEHLTMPTTFTGQNGAVINQSTKIAVTGCMKAIRVVKHKKKAKGKKASITVAVPSAGKLTASGTGLSGATARASSAGSLTVNLTLSQTEQSFLARHRGRMLATHIKLQFTSNDGKTLTSSLMLLFG